MKKVILLFFMTLLANTLCYCQTEKPDYVFNDQTFDQAILTFVPIKRAGVTDDQYNLALRILGETKSSTKAGSEKLNVADYWNITGAFVRLKEPAVNIEIAFKKAITLDADAVCSYVKAFGGSPNLEKTIPETFLAFYAKCSLPHNSSTKQLDPKQYAKDNQLDEKLVSLFSLMQVNDQKFRSTTPFDAVKQNPFDLKNQHLVDSLYAVYKTYIGKSYVGKEYESVMWVVIQHSNIQMMEKYLPDVSKAVQEKELQVVPLKMLIDRIYSIKYHYQIFGSQVNVPVTDDQTVTTVKKKYKID
jgi:hypothetical protein